MSPGRRVGITNCSTQARKLSALIGASRMQGGGEAVPSQSGHEGECLTLAVWHFGDQTLTSGAAAMQAGHVGIRQDLVDEDQTGHINLTLSLLPLSSPARHVRPILLTRPATLWMACPKPRTQAAFGSGGEDKWPNRRLPCVGSTWARTA